MKQELEAIRAKALEAIGGAEKAEDLEALRVQYLGKKGELTAVLKQMGSLSAEERPVIGQLANEVRAKLEESVETRAKELAAKALEMVGLDKSYYEKSPFELSGGQKRRVAIAGVLAMQPEVLVLDEPTAGLDPKGRDEILDQVSALHKSQGMTVVLVSHSMEDVARYVDRLMVMNAGQKVYDGTPKEVFRHYKELEEIGLSAPQVTYIVQGLRERGIPVSEDVTTVPEAKAEILKLLGRGTKC